MTERTPRTFRKKPVVIEAMLWTGEDNEGGIQAAVKFCQPLPHAPDDPHIHTELGYTPSDGKLYIPTLEGTMCASPGDWIIKGVKGEFYPCKPDIFQATYERTDTREAGMPDEPKGSFDSNPVGWWDYINSLKTAHAALREENEALKVERDMLYESAGKLQADLDAAMEALSEAYVFLAPSDIDEHIKWRKKNAAILSKSRRT